MPGGTRSNRLLVWQLTNASSLDSPKPDLELSTQILKVGKYSAPLPAEQKKGPVPARSVRQRHQAVKHPSARAAGTTSSQSSPPTTKCSPPLDSGDTEDAAGLVRRRQAVRQPSTPASRSTRTAKPASSGS